MSIQIVGVMGDGKHFTLSEDPEAAAFFPITQEGDTKTSFIVRTTRDTADIVASVREAVRGLDRAVPIEESGPWTSQLGLSLFPSQVATVALGLFGAFGLLLSIAGTFGLASYTVSKRLRELSIRVALGAQAKQILAAALGRMLILLGAGSVIGIVLRHSRQPSPLRHRLSSHCAGSHSAVRRRIHHSAHRIAFGCRPGETSSARRPGNPAPRTVIFKQSVRIPMSASRRCSGRCPHSRRRSSGPSEGLLTACRC